VTVKGLDGLPVWLLRLAAPVYTTPLAYLINLSVNNASVPNKWKTLVIRPVAKVPRPTEPSDYRPISIAPVLLRVVERLVIQMHIYSAFQGAELKAVLS